MNRAEHPWAVVAALPQELAPLRRISHQNCSLIVTGMGIENADRNLRAHLREKEFAGVFGIGLAGALTPSLRIGDLVIGQEVHGESIHHADAQLLDAAGKIRLSETGINFGTIVTVNEIVCTAWRKRQLAEKAHSCKLSCVDMESWAFSRVCAENDIPCLNIRCISDLLEEDLPLDFNRFRKPDGNLGLLSIAMAALIRPRVIGGLWKMRSNAQFCAHQLACFVTQVLSTARKLETV